MNTPHVAILMTVRDGARHLPDQLQSFSDQGHTHWTLLASDDGSTDNSRDLIRAFGVQGHAVHLFDGPQKGHAANTLFILSKAKPLIDEGAWVATSDQDDIWLPHRISGGIQQLQGLKGPALYCSRTIICSNDMVQHGPSKDHRRQPGFRNALVQNIASGNTTLLNAEAARLVCTAAEATERMSIPDWWVYQIVTGAGGTVVFDQTPTVLYRQHHGNQLGENRSVKARARRVAMMLSGILQTWNDANIDALRKNASRLSPENRDILNNFSELRSATIIRKLSLLWGLGLYRQSFVGTIGIWIATLMGRM